MNEYGCVLIQQINEDDAKVFGYLNCLTNWNIQNDSVYFGTFNSEQVFKLIEKLNIPYFDSKNRMCHKCFYNKEIKSNTSFYVKGINTIDKYNKIKTIIEEKFNVSIQYENKRARMITKLCSHHIHELGLRDEIQKYVNKLVYYDELEDSKIIKSEKEIENILVNNIEKIEKGMKFIGAQVPIDEGLIDILAEDKEGNTCIIEVKNKGNDERLIFQCLYYPTTFNKKVRMITIAPNYNAKIHKILKELDHVEVKKFKFINYNELIIENVN